MIFKGSLIGLVIFQVLSWRWCASIHPVGPEYFLLSWYPDIENLYKRYQVKQPLLVLGLAMMSAGKLPWNTLETKLNYYETIIEISIKTLQTLAEISLKNSIKIPQSGICPAPCVLRQWTVIFAWKCFIFSVFARMCNAAYVIFIMWNSISRRLSSFSVKHQLWSGCHGERSSKKYQVTF